MWLIVQAHDNLYNRDSLFVAIEDSSGLHFLSQTRRSLKGEIYDERNNQHRDVHFGMSLTPLAY